jgi:hypothetical protein
VALVQAVLQQIKAAAAALQEQQLVHCLLGDGLHLAGPCLADCW